jgi:hypothetical protein
MELKEIISISGKPGLYRVIARSAKNFIVESIDGQKTRFSVSASQQVALLDEITVYTESTDGLSLKTVFENIESKKADSPVPTPKDSPVVIRDYFKIIAPGYDQERVYISDMKKILKWYDIVSKLKTTQPAEIKEAEPSEN